MANYLQRVITAGARIQSSAKPPASVPAIVPSILAPIPTPSSEKQPADASGEVAEPISSPRPVEPLVLEERTVPAVAETPAKPAAQRPVPLSIAIARMTSGTRIQAPKALRPRTSMPGGPPTKAPAIEPANLMAALTPRAAPAALPVSGTRAKETPATQAPKPAKADLTVLERKAVVRPRNDSRRDSAWRPNPQPEPDRSSVAPEFRAIQIKPRPSQPPAAPVVAVEERGNSRQSRITIGKVDVQVNNQRPARNSVPSRTPSGGPRSNFLEARYLSRFPMRP